ncbi:MAG: hypothetical protein ABFR90_04675 [Planctomycetota bacterium]
MNKQVLLFSLALLLGGCLDFGEDIELSGEDVDSTVLANVTKLTGVVFPAGTEGKHYIYWGSGIDPALAIKVSIPKDRKSEFFKNTIFVSGKNKEPYIHLGKGKSWWKVESLTNPIHTRYDFSNGDVIECTVGEESGETIVYLSWITV